MYAIRQYHYILRNPVTNFMAYLLIMATNSYFQFNQYSRIKRTRICFIMKIITDHICTSLPIYCKDENQKNIHLRHTLDRKCPTDIFCSLTCPVLHLNKTPWSRILPLACIMLSIVTMEIKSSFDGIHIK